MKYTLEKFNEDIKLLAEQIMKSNIKYQSLYPVMRGGFPVAMALSQKLNIPIEDKLSPSPFILIVDDVIDSGKTHEKYIDWDFACLHVKRENWEYDISPPKYFVDYFPPTEWIEYFWEKNEMTGEDEIIRLLQIIGENPNREGLLETPKRFLSSWKFLFSGYQQSSQDVFKTFSTPSGYDEIVLLKDIEMYSMCEHHILPFFGKAHIAYIPNEKVIGISKLARLLDIYSHRLQIQERLCQQITEDIMKYLQPKGAACIIEAQHLCMKMRGVEKQNSTMITSSLKGVFLTNSSSKEELMRLIR